MQCRICSPNEIEQGLLHRQLDLGIGYFGQQLEALRYQPWLEETQAIYCSADHPLFAVVEPSASRLKRAGSQRGLLRSSCV